MKGNKSSSERHLCRVGQRVGEEPTNLQGPGEGDDIAAKVLNTTRRTDRTGSTVLRLSAGRTRRSYWPPPEATVVRP